MSGVRTKKWRINFFTPARAQASQDLSPIYEEIHGGSRSTVSTTSSGSSSGVSRATAAAAACGKFHYSLFEFAATETTMLSVARGQVLRVIQVSIVLGLVSLLQGLVG